MTLQHFAEQETSRGSNIFSEKKYYTFEDTNSAERRSGNTIGSATELGSHSEKKQQIRRSHHARTNVSKLSQRHLCKITNVTITSNRTHAFETQ